MIPAYNPTAYPSFHNIIRHLRKALWWEDARGIACFNFSRYDVIDPKRLILQSTHQESDSFDWPVDVTRYPLNNTICDEDLEQAPSRAPGVSIGSPDKASIANPNDKAEGKLHFHHIPVHSTWQYSSQPHAYES
jgi:hypothetical protein